uniref:Serine protease like protein n=1 Tax=Cryptotympana facialis TaxID=911377 RepID=N0DPA8_9HEMI|nr:serine protease like protein [Cryptotympana facialis]BAP76071.1 serine protease like protein [Cryptotympana facialis]
MANVQPIFAVLSVLLVISKSQTVMYSRDCVCGTKNYNTSRIYNGEETRPNEYPWLALVVSLKGEKFYDCGGSIISNKYVLSAAHCFDETTRRVDVYLGVHDVTEAENGHVKKYTVQHVIIHPRYDDVDSLADIALLKLSEKIRFSRTIRPICLPENERELRGNSLLFAGWGETEHGETSDYLKHTRLFELSRKHCSQVLDLFGHPSDDLPNVICAYHETANACQGDSGGPTMDYLKGYDRVLAQTGLLSYGDECPEPRRHHIVTVNIFTKVTSFLNWIYSNTEDSVYCLRPNRR